MLGFVVIAAALVVGERIASALFPFPRHLIDELPRSVRVHAADGTLLRVFATRAGERVIPVALATVSPHLRRALIRAEDERFASHRGVDVLAAGRAAWQNVSRGCVVSGASTITMQVVRILMPQKPRSMAFKFEQVFRARQLERILTKDEILAIYINHVPLGGAVRGFDAAARRWFRIGAAELRAEQAATLVAMLPAPSYRSPRRRPDLILRLRNRLLARMRDAGDLNKGEYLRAVRQPLGARRRPWPFLAPHACDHFARRSAARELRTRLDVALQRRIEELVAARDGAGTDAVAVVVLERPGGALRAMVGSADYLVTQLNTATCRRSVGSTLKPFLYALALDRGVVGVDGLVDDTPLRLGDYRPANFSRDYVGAIGVAEALASSRNLPAVRLLRAVSEGAFADLLQRLGLPPDPRGLHLDAALGTMTASPLQLASAYGTFVDGSDRVGLRRSTVRRVLHAMSRRPLSPGSLTGRLAWKSGTSSGRRDAWCVGVTGAFVAVVWLGNLSGRGEPGLVGGESAGRLLSRVVALLPE